MRVHRKVILPIKRLNIVYEAIGEDIEYKLVVFLIKFRQRLQILEAGLISLTSA